MEVEDVELRRKANLPNSQSRAVAVIQNTGLVHNHSRMDFQFNVQWPTIVD